MGEVFSVEAGVTKAGSRSDLSASGREEEETRRVPFASSRLLRTPDAAVGGASEQWRWSERMGEEEKGALV